MKLKNSPWKTALCWAATITLLSFFPRVVQSSSSSSDSGGGSHTTSSRRSSFHARSIIRNNGNARFFGQHQSSSKWRHQRQRQLFAFCTPVSSTSIIRDHRQNLLVTVGQHHHVVSSTCKQQQQRGLLARSTRCITLLEMIDPWNDHDRSIPIMMELQKQNDAAAAAAKQHDDDASMATTTTTTTILHENNKNGDDSLPLGQQLATTTTTSASAAVVLLNVVAILWGTQHAVIKLIVTDNGNDPASFTLLRFGIAALLASPYTPGGGLLPSSLSSFFQSPFQQQHDNNINKDQLPPPQQWWQLQNGGGDTVDDDLVVSQANSATASQAPSNEAAAAATTTDDANNANANMIAWRWGLEMGFWMFLGFCFQAIGLEYTTAQKSGFLLYLNVKFVPFFAYILLGRSITTATWVSALTAFCGTALLACAGGTGAGAGGVDAANALNVGDACSIAAAAASAMFILRLEKASAAVPNAATLNAACLWTVTGLASLWTLWTTTTTATAVTAFSSSSSLSSSFPADVKNVNNGLVIIMTTLQTVWDQVVSIGLGHPWEILYLSAVTTALANYIQTKAQAEISPERACIIYAMDPVYGAIFAAWLLGEQLPGGAWGYVGAGMITLAAATNAFLDLSPGSDDDSATKTTSNNNDNVITTSPLVVNDDKTSGTFKEEGDGDNSSSFFEK